MSPSSRTCFLKLHYGPIVWHILNMSSNVFQNIRAHVIFRLGNRSDSVLQDRSDATECVRFCRNCPSVCKSVCQKTWTRETASTSLSLGRVTGVHPARAPAALQDRYCSADQRPLRCLQRAAARLLRSFRFRLSRRGNLATDTATFWRKFEAMG